MENDNKHTASFLASIFLMSKHSLKKLYSLNIGGIAILRYICDSIDLNFKKRKKFETKLYQAQIAKFCRCSLTFVKEQIKHLLKKRLLKYDAKKRSFKIGKVLSAWALRAYTKEVAATRLEVRSSRVAATSYSSNFTNSKAGSTNHKKQIKSTEQSAISNVEKQSTSFDKSKEGRQERGSALLEEYMQKEKEKALCRKNAKTGFKLAKKPI